MRNKRYIRIRTVLVFIAFTLSVFVFGLSETVYATSQSDVENWLDYEIYTYAPRVHGRGECVDFCNHYLTNCWGTPAIGANAKDWRCPLGWTPIDIKGNPDNLQLGDLIVEDIGPYSPNGHVMVYYGKEGGNHQVVDQNSDYGKIKYPAKHKWWSPLSNATYVYRPPYSDTSNPSLTVNLSNLQSISGTSFPITGTLKNAGNYPYLKLYVDYAYITQTWNNEFGNYAFYLDTTKYSDGAHKIGVKMVNDETSLDYTAWFDIYVNNNNPSSCSGNVSYTVTNINNGSVLSGTNACVEGYVYGGGTYPWMNLYLGSSNMVAETYNNEYGAYRFTFDTTKYANGSYRLGVRLRNQDGYDYTIWFDVVVNNQEKHNHSLVRTPAKAATTSAEGNIEYWTCNSCGKLFKDSAGKTEITKAQTVIPKLTPAPSDPDNQSVTPGSSSKKVDLPAVTITSAKSAKKAAVVKWKKVSKKNQKKIARIQIQYTTDKNFKKGVKTATASKSATSKTIKKLKSRKQYYFRIRSYKKDGKVTHVSKWSKVKRAKIK